MLVELLNFFFFSFHDPMAKDRQGLNQGRQISSTILVATEGQRALAQAIIADVQAAMDANVRRYLNKWHVVTVIKDASKFNKADAGHQQYLEGRPK